jgi:hypothetical protein
MNKVEATDLLDKFLEELKSRSREELLGLISNPVCIEKMGQSGTVYQIEYEAVWDSEPGRDLRIIASIDDGGFLSALVPVTSGFLVSPSGETVD